ncbi:sensor signal transduction histidine kinase [Candidatus Magnetobacterium bavaricum]|uniref:Sensor signal transduction histidine kinase n=1 Tax=Candidatus Magnetobacterium bavaricum TaxID=29290 RepID=A0A0F3GU94_9BACT|nr:sensor signal transduction histidine kinase [Candidatus Magnetobacterium bavaricum]
MTDLSREEIIELIKSNILFQNISSTERFDENALSKAYDIIHFSWAKKGDVIIEEGVRGETLILVLKGVVGVLIKTDDGKDMQIATVGEDSFFGEMALMENVNRTATMRAETDCLFGVINRADFWEYFYMYPVIGKNLLWGSNQRLRQANIEVVKHMAKEKEYLLTFTRELEKQVQEKTDLLRQKDVQLVEMDRIASLGILAAGIAHEINNPLSFIKSGVGFIDKTVSILIKDIKQLTGQAKDIPAEEGVDVIDEMTLDHRQLSIERKISMMNRGIARISKITANLLNIARLDMDPFGRIDLNKSIEDIVGILGTNDATNIKFVMILGNIPLFDCSPSGINQCLLHILNNAIDAIEGSGTVRISTSYDEKSDKIVIQVTDNGKGMTKEVLKQVFVPFLAWFIKAKK